jgi:hypothetical protein
MFIFLSFDSFLDFIFQAGIADAPRRERRELPAPGHTHTHTSACPASSAVRRQTKPERARHPARRAVFPVWLRPSRVCVFVFCSVLTAKWNIWRASPKIERVGSQPLPTFLPTPVSVPTRDTRAGASAGSAVARKTPCGSYNTAGAQHPRPRHRAVFICLSYIYKHTHAHIHLSISLAHTHASALR